MLVPAICTQCGAQVSIDNTKEAAVCPACGTPFIVEKAVRNYNTTVVNNNYIEHAVVGSNSKSEAIERFCFYLKINDQAKLSNEIKTFQDKWPMDPLGLQMEIFVFCKRISSLLKLGSPEDVALVKETLDTLIKKGDEYYGEDIILPDDSILPDYTELVNDTLAFLEENKTNGTKEYRYLMYKKTVIDEFVEDISGKAVILKRKADNIKKVSPYFIIPFAIGLVAILVSFFMDGSYALIGGAIVAGTSLVVELVILILIKKTNKELDKLKKIKEAGPIFKSIDEFEN